MKVILLVEDNEDDVFFMKMACQRTGIPHDLHVVGDGDSAINYLTGKPPYDDRGKYPMPNIIFLDIKMPKRNGLEVLKWIRAQPLLENLPVVMLTGSAQMEDIERAYKLGVTSYLQKAACMAEFGQGVRVVLKYWFELNNFPAQ